MKDLMNKDLSPEEIELIKQNPQAAFNLFKKVIAHEQEEKTPSTIVNVISTTGDIAQGLLDKMKDGFVNVGRKVVDTTSELVEEGRRVKARKAAEEEYDKKQAEDKAAWLKSQGFE